MCRVGPAGRTGTRRPGVKRHPELSPPVASLADVTKIAVSPAERVVPEVHRWSGFGCRLTQAGKRTQAPLVDVLGIPITDRVGAANISDPVAGSRLLAGLPRLWPTIGMIIADAGHESGKLAAQPPAGRLGAADLQAQAASFQGRRADMDRRTQFRMAWFQPALIEGLRASCSDIGTMLDIAAIRLMLKRIAE